jgi:16S rRNA (guanine(966)-N(2))-methyltransferase RsmD
MRERCFAVLAERVVDGRFLDLFAGTGVVGIEALSRGASSTVFVDAHRSAIKLITANLEALGVGRDRGQALNRPAAEAIPLLARQERVFDLIWADPPFEIWHRGLEAITAAVEAGLALKEATLCLECPPEADVEGALPEDLSLERDLKGGASRVVFLRRT